MPNLNQDGLTALRSRLAEMKAYLEAVVAEKIPANNQILYNCQAIFNLMPNLYQDALVESMLVKNKIQNKRLEEEEEAKAEESKKDEEKKEEDKKEGDKDKEAEAPASAAKKP